MSWRTGGRENSRNRKGNNDSREKKVTFQRNESKGNDRRGRSNRRSSNESSEPPRQRSTRENGQNDQFSGPSTSRGHKNFKDNQNQETKVIRPMGFKLMKSLIENDDLEEIISQLSNDKKGFKQLLENRDIQPDLVVMVVKLWSKICGSSFQGVVNVISETILRSNFIETVVTYIPKLIMQTPREKKSNDFFWKDPDEFWENIALISQNLNNVIPTSSCQSMLKILTAAKTFLPIIESTFSIHTADEIKNKISTLQAITEDTTKRAERKRDKPVRYEESMDEPPPNDFRDIDVYPSAVEITVRQSPYLRPNIVDRPYDNIDQYLDIQFRLLREDFVRPLREGICDYLDKSKRKYDNIKIYPAIRFLCLENVTEQNCYRIQFDLNPNRKKRKVNYEHSKRFMFGSLLCFTKDNFASVLFGKVVQRDIKDLEKSQIIVGFDENVTLPTAMYEKDFLMVESSVYFEPYYHVLSVLKSMGTDRFPMERYIIRVKTDLEPPEYLLQIDPFFYEIEGHKFWPLDWNDRTFYNLNESQQIAFKAALTQEFVIIQGPPGTGKTFLGLKIARTLIENSSVWYRSSPILVICFTNHALDQFLEGLAQVTDNILRVGGQSKNEKLNKFNIRKKRDFVDPAVIQKRREVRDLLTQIQNINESLRIIEEGQTMLDFDHFADFVPYYTRSKLYDWTSDKLLEWLFSGIDRSRNRWRQPNELPVKLQTEEPNQNVENEEEIKMEVEDIEDDANMEVDEIFEGIEIKPFRSLVSVQSLQKRADFLVNQLRTTDWRTVVGKGSLERELNTALFELDYLKLRLSQFQIGMEVEQPDYIDVEFPFRMDNESRWQLYFHWLSIYIKEIKQLKENLTKQFKKVFKIYTELRELEDARVMKRSLVVGMTTTGAARLRSSLQSLKSPIVIVEEAAEVLEAHIVTALTNHCQHLILIGDHQQLKPSTANFKIETQFRLGISLFERMVLNKIQCYTLNVQHRMRPEISSLICPLIYPNLQNHESVMDRPHILGVEKSVFFIDHTNPETVCDDNSKKNVHEAQFLIQLARHLILNNYKPENITILAAYLGQMFELKRESRKHELFLKDVRIAVLDNYQGEESDIILLSLVRNNPENKIGFLRIENRVCVALSRARNGFYVMGNMKQLTHESKLWVEINDTFQKQQAIGNHLTLQCQIHRHKFSDVQCADDFLKFPEGGCDLKCETLLRCGHICTRLCHVEDKEHVQYECREKCEKILCEDPTHICTKFCFKVCGPCYYKVTRELPCGHSATMECHEDPLNFQCRTKVMTVLPCGHETMKPCFKDRETFRCPFPCETRVEPCGHACTKNCHVKKDPDHLEYKCEKACEKIRGGCSMKEPNDKHICPKLCFEKCSICDIEVPKTRAACSHVYTIACHVDVDSMECRKPCKKIFPCGHKCFNKCCEPCGDCSIIIDKIVPDCGHKVKVACSSEPDRKYCEGKCPKLLPCGHKCENRCNEPCTTTCQALAECSVAGICGHIVKKLPCHLKNSVDPEIVWEYCTEKCHANLKCSHTCTGTCGKCHQGRIHVRCNAKCGVPLICNHECPIPCRQNCQPCKQECQYYCGHSKCSKPCGEPCTACKEPCRRVCMHQKCTKRCSDICSVPPCSRPCSLRLRKCGHPCVGFCGEPCPTLCRLCDNETLTEVFLGNEDEPDAVYVMLEDCKHIFESSDLDRYMMMGDDEKGIQAKRCPRCTITITRSQRYNEILKENMKDLVNVKRRSYGTATENEKARIQLKGQLLSMDRTMIKYLTPIDMDITERLFRRLEPIITVNEMRRRQTINRMVLQAIKAKIEILEMLLKVFKDNDYVITNNVKSFEIVNLILKVFSRSADSIAEQEVEDVSLEIQRLCRSVQYEKIQQSGSYSYSYSSNSKVKTISDRIKTIINNRKRYDDNQDRELQNQLNELKKLVSCSLHISEAEKREIVTALKLTPGHWYKCPNGHPYIITECGGAMQVSKCNECGAPIGGTDHQLLASNSHTGEFDGSRYSAWSQQANLANYGRLDLF